jgi:hypothetical protein
LTLPPNTDRLLWHLGEVVVDLYNKAPRTATRRQQLISVQLERAYWHGTHASSLPDWDLSAKHVQQLLRQSIPSLLATLSELIDIALSSRVPQTPCRQMRCAIEHLKIAFAPGYRSEHGTDRSKGR